MKLNSISQINVKDSCSFHTLLAFVIGYHNRDSLIHPTRAIQFLVGVGGKNEAMAIGGPWSPSLDGPNPVSDPSVR